MRHAFKILLLLFLISCKGSIEKLPLEQKNYITGNYYDRLYKADSLFIINDYQKSFTILQKLFKEYKPLQLPIYSELKTYIKSAYLIGEKDVALSQLKNLISNYSILWSQIKNDTVLAKLIKENNFKTEDYEIIKEEFNTKIHPRLRKQIVEMNESDQLYRGRKAQYLINHKKAQDSIDEENRDKIEKMFNSIGYPNYHKLGEEPYVYSNKYNIKFILLHTPDSIRKQYFLPKLLEYVKLGECNPYIYMV